MLVFLLACATDKMTGPAGEEPVRGALYYPIADPATEIQFEAGNAAVLIVANSALPCAPDTVENDPATTQDEAAEARAYWEYQLYSAFTREGALTVGFVLFTAPDADPVGEYLMDEDAYDQAEDLIGDHARLSTGFWSYVEEAGTSDDDEDAAIPLPSILESEGEERLDDPATVEVLTHGGVEVTGSFDLDPDDVSGTFTAEVCENEDLVDLFLAYVVELGLL
jgi:hypothetical protein